MQTFVMSEEALANYGEQWRDVVLIVTHAADRHMPADEFFAQARPDGFHPSYDGEGPLYHLKGADTGEELPFSLYDWKLQEAPRPTPGMPV